MANYHPAIATAATIPTLSTSLTVSNPTNANDQNYSTFATGTAFIANPLLVSQSLIFTFGDFTTLPATNAPLELRARFALTTGGTSPDRHGRVRLGSTTLSFDNLIGYKEVTWTSTNIGPDTIFDLVVSAFGATKFTGNFLRGGTNLWHSRDDAVQVTLSQLPFTQQATQGTNGFEATIKLYECWIADAGVSPGRQITLV